MGAEGPAPPDRDALAGGGTGSVHDDPHGGEPPLPAAAPRRGPVRRLLRWWASQGDLHRELLAAAILAIIPLIGLVGWWLSRSLSDFELEQNIRQQYLVNELEDRRAALAAFADEIPKNNLVVCSLGRLRAWLERPDSYGGGTTPGGEPLFTDGRTAEQVRTAYDKQQTYWLKSLHHYTALIQGVKMNFLQGEANPGPAGLPARDGPGAAGAPVEGDTLRRHIAALEVLLDGVNGLSHLDAATVSALQSAITEARQLLQAGTSVPGGAPRRCPPPVEPDSDYWGSLAPCMALIDEADVLIDALYERCLEDMQALLYRSRSELLSER